MASTFKESLVGLIPSLRAFAVSLCGDAVRADDLVQDTLVKAMDHAASFEEGSNLRAWLFTILRNTYFSECRKRWREIEMAGGSPAEGVPALPGQQSCLDLRDFRVALMELPAEQREALILVGAAGMSCEEVAAISGCAIGTVKSRVNRARRKLTARLGIACPEDFGPDACSVAVIARRAVARG